MFGLEARVEERWRNSLGGKLRSEGEGGSERIWWFGTLDTSPFCHAVLAKFTLRQSNLFIERASPPIKQNRPPMPTAPNRHNTNTVNTDTRFLSIRRSPVRPIPPDFNPPFLHPHSLSNHPQNSQSLLHPANLEQHDSRPDHSAHIQQPGIKHILLSHPHVRSRERHLRELRLVVPYRARTVAGKAARGDVRRVADDDVPFARDVGT